jgi:hypothetical protein
MKPLHGSPTRLSWICGRTPIPTFPSTSKPKPSTPSSENELHKRDDGLIETEVDPQLKNLHSDPRYPAFLKKLNLPT